MVKVCPVCGEQFKSKRSNQRICFSFKCRRKYESKYKQKRYKKQKYQKRKCSVCNNYFTPKTYHQIYCTLNCGRKAQIANYHKNKKLKREEKPKSELYQLSERQKKATKRIITRILTGSSSLPELTTGDIQREMSPDRICMMMQNVLDIKTQVIGLRR